MCLAAFYLLTTVYSHCLSDILLLKEVLISWRLCYYCMQPTSFIKRAECNSQPTISAKWKQACPLPSETFFRRMSAIQGSLHDRQQPRSHFTRCRTGINNFVTFETSSNYLLIFLWYLKKVNGEIVHTFSSGILFLDILNY